MIFQFSIMYFVTWLLLADLRFWWIVCDFSVFHYNFVAWLLADLWFSWIKWVLLKPYETHSTITVNAVFSCTLLYQATQVHMYPLTYLLNIVYMCNSSTCVPVDVPVSHCTPVHPPIQVHVYLATPSTHVALFIQGLLAQSSMSEMGYNNHIICNTLCISHDSFRVISTHLRYNCTNAIAHVNGST